MAHAFLPTALRQPRFGTLMRRYRETRKLTIRQAAAESGIPRSTWDRAEGGSDVWLSTASLILAWMAQFGEIEDEATDA